ncbi:MAG: nickel-dependent lactate racemase [bacterium]|jgi:nickel-dependent lactate racemase
MVGKGLKKFKLRYGKGDLELAVPEENIMAVLTPRELAGVADEEAEVRRALANPIGSPALRALAQGKENVVILVSDLTRPAPSYKMLPSLLDELAAAGVTDDQITIVFGLGYHRKHTEQEQRQLVGDRVFERVKCLDHDINQCVYVGETSSGTPVEVFQPVLAADLIIGTANLEFHYRAGYSGGDKSLMPGVCSKRTIQANHTMMIKPGTMPGKADGNPMREDIEEVGRMVGVSFILNVVLNSNKEIVKAVAGDPVQAHREGCKYIDQMYKRPLAAKADIVIASTGGYPKDINLYQAQKGLEHASYAVKEGGVVILLAECPEVLGEETFADWMARAQSPDDPIRWAQEEFVLGAHKAAMICLALKRAQVYLVSSIEPALVQDIFFQPFSSPEAALAAALEKEGHGAKIVVIPFANSTLPVVEG